MSGTSHLLNLYGALIKMMGRRGYDIKDRETIFEYTPEFFESVFNGWAKQNPTPVQAALLKAERSTTRAMLSHIFTRGETERTLVYFADVGNKQVPIAETVVFGKLMFDMKCQSGIIITNAKLAPKAAGQIAEFQSSGTNYIQHFLDESILVDPTITEWGSKMRILTDEEAKTFLVDNKLLTAHLPKIDVEQDPVAKYYGVKVGQIVELLRVTFLPEMLCDTEIFHRFAYRRPQDKKKK
ncbi:DNA-directed RNA polymerase subunit RPB5 [uncultured virus]|nr:DNA-directed RNA polymerase subunit RPB5 [uncultured virus]